MSKADTLDWPLAARATERSRSGCQAQRIFSLCNWWNCLPIGKKKELECNRCFPGLPARGTDRKQTMAWYALDGIIFLNTSVCKLGHGFVACIKMATSPCSSGSMVVHLEWLLLNPCASQRTHVSTHMHTPIRSTITCTSVEHPEDTASPALSLVWGLPWYSFLYQWYKTIRIPGSGHDHFLPTESWEGGFLFCFAFSFFFFLQLHAYTCT